MHGTTTHRHYQAPPEGAPFTQRPYWGWSHRNQRMEFMDLPTYVDSYQRGYDAAFGDLMARMQQLASPGTALAPPATALASSAAPAGPALGQFPDPSWAGQARDWRGHHEHGHYEHWHREHGHHEHGYHEPWHREHGYHEHERHRGGRCGCGCEDARGRDCGCRPDRECDGCDDCRGRGHGWRGRRDCRCDCCICDADIVVYARCGEIRAVPIEVVNDSRKIRENVDVEVSDVRSGGGRVLPWHTLLRPAGPLTLQPCSTTRLELLVEVVCGDQRDEAGTSSGTANNETTSSSSGSSGSSSSSGGGGAASSGNTTGATAEQSAPDSVLARLPSEAPDVDRCEVGYITIRLGGCLIRPIVVAIAVLPRVCDSYRAGCSCSCCGC